MALDRRLWATGSDLEGSSFRFQERLIPLPLLLLLATALILLTAKHAIAENLPAMIYDLFAGEFIFAEIGNIDGAPLICIVYVSGLLLDAPLSTIPAQAPAQSHSVLPL